MHSIHRNNIIHLANSATFSFNLENDGLIKIPATSLSNYESTDIQANSINNQGFNFKSIVHCLNPPYLYVFTDSTA